MTAERRSAYQAFLIAAGELFSALTAAAAGQPPPETFLAGVGDGVAAIDRAHSGLLLVASQDALAAATEVKQRAHRILEFLDPYQPSPTGLGDLSQEYVFACNAFTQIARDEVGALRPGWTEGLRTYAILKNDVPACIDTGNFHAAAFGGERWGGGPAGEGDPGPRMRGSP
jgi:hypothetical protein